MNADTRDRGVTLVEAVVTIVVLSVVAAALVAIMLLHNTEINEGTASTWLQMRGEAVHMQLGRDVRLAGVVLCMDETWAADGAYPSTLDCTEIYCYNETGGIFAAYQMHDNSLFEARFDPAVTSVEDDDYSPFFVGSQPVNLTGGDRFELSPQRKHLVLYTTLTTTYRGKTYSLPIQGNMYRCRN